MSLAKISSVAARISVVRHGLVDHAAQPVRAGLRRDRDRALPALPQQPDDRLREVVEAQRCRADRVAHVEEPGQDPLDLRVIAERDRDEPGLARVLLGPGGELENAIGGKGADRQVVVPRPAEAAQVRAAAHHFDEEPRSELGVGREDRRRRRIEAVDRSSPRPSSRPAARRCPASARTPRSCRRRRSARRRTTECRTRVRARAAAGGRRDRRPRESRPRAPGSGSPLRPPQSRRRTGRAARGSRTSRRRRSRPADRARVRASARGATPASRSSVTTLV